MSEETFIKLQRQECREILERIGSAIDGSSFDPETVTILAQNLDFYPGYRLLDITDYETPPFKKRFVVYGDEVRVINWKNEVIYDLNKKAPVCLSENNICDYVRFFFSFVRGRHGRFSIIEKIDDIEWQNDPPSSVQRSVGSVIKPISLLHKDDQKFLLSAHLIFKSSMFKVKIEVEKEGLITVSEEELVLDDMPVIDGVLAA